MNLAYTSRPGSARVFLVVKYFLLAIKYFLLHIETWLAKIGIQEDVGEGNILHPGGKIFFPFAQLAKIGIQDDVEL